MGRLSLNGKWLVLPKYEKTSGFSEGFAAVKEENKFEFIDTKGNVLAAGFDWANSFSEGLAAVNVGGKWGFIDATGKFAIEPKYVWVNQTNKYPAGFSPVDSFSEGLSKISLESGATIYIDRTGRTVLQLANGVFGRSFSDDRAVISSFTSDPVYESYGIIDMQAMSS